MLYLLKRTGKAGLAAWAEGRVAPNEVSSRHRASHQPADGKTRIRRDIAEKSQTWTSCGAMGLHDYVRRLRLKCDKSRPNHLKFAPLFSCSIQGWGWRVLWAWSRGTLLTHGCFNRTFVLLRIPNYANPKYCIFFRSSVQNVHLRIHFSSTKHTCTPLHDCTTYSQLYLITKDIHSSIIKNNKNKSSYGITNRHTHAMLNTHRVFNKGRQRRQKEQHDS